MTCILLQELCASDLDWMMQAGVHHHVPAETHLFDPTRSIDEVYLLLEGMAAIATRIPQAALAHPSAPSSDYPQAVTTLFQIPCGDLIGISAVLESNRLPYDVLTESPCQVLSISRSRLQQKLREDLSFAARFYRAIAMLLSARNQRLMREFAYQEMAMGRSPLRQAITLFAELEDGDLDWLAAVGIVQQVPAERVLLPSGRSPDALHILLEGALLLSQPVEMHNLIAQTLAPAANLTSAHREVARLSRGDLLGELQLVEAHDLTLCASTLRDSQILSIPRWRLAAKLLHDAGFASRFYRVLATLLSAEYETMLHQLYAATGSPADGPGDRSDVSSSLLTRISLAEARFEWLLQRVQAQQENGRDLQW